MGEGSLDIVHEWFDLSGGDSNNEEAQQKQQQQQQQPKATASGGGGDGASSASAEGSDAKAGGGDEGQEETAEVAAAGMTDAEVLKVVVDTVAVSVLRCDPASIMEQVDAPVPSLGLGSMEGVQVGGLRSCDAAKLPVRRKS